MYKVKVSGLDRMWQALEKVHNKTLSYFRCHMFSFFMFGTSRYQACSACGKILRSFRFKQSRSMQSRIQTLH